MESIDAPPGSTADVATLASSAAAATSAAVAAAAAAPVAEAAWAADAQKELHKIPFFVRGKARRNTERYARDCGLSVITLETLYDAKAHFSH